jgi:hypothetical protein
MTAGLQEFFIADGAAAITIASASTVSPLVRAARARRAPDLADTVIAPLLFVLAAYAWWRSQGTPLLGHVGDAPSAVRLIVVSAVLLVVCVVGAHFLRGLAFARPKRDGGAT